MEVRITGTRPMRFPGTPEEIAANRATHCFSWDADGRCLNCDSRDFGVASQWPCGQPVPREDIAFIGSDEEGWRPLGIPNPLELLLRERSST